MWNDIETNQDFLNFRVMAMLAAQMILDAKGRPLSIGVSGGWGVGKSSMLKLIEEELRAKKADKVLYLTFNAWLYQGHDDAKAALMEEISRALVTEAKKVKDGASTLAKAKDLASRVNWFRMLRMGGEIGASIALGFPVSPLLKGAEAIWDRVADGDISPESLDAAKQLAAEHASQLKGLIKPKANLETPPQMIQALRTHFEELLKELDITIVVFVDDLDRCLPPTVIGTLEAMRLFLFMERTAFVIAADDTMIKESVRIHFKDAKLSEDLVVSYFDKLIQVPLRVPALGINEVRAYLMLLFIENSELNESVKEQVRRQINHRLSESWKGESVTPSFVADLITDCPTLLKGKFALADRLAKQMVVSSRIGGNPRLIKRFLNTLYIRQQLASLQTIPVDESLLAKILLFERCATAASFDFLVRSVNQSLDGKSEALVRAETFMRDGGELPSEGFEAWSSDKVFVTEWLQLDPLFGNLDLRGALHVGRETLPLVSASDRVSPEAQEVTKGLLALSVACQPDLRARFKALAPDERTFVMDKLLARAANEPSWGIPKILYGLSAVAEEDSDQAKRLIVFLSTRQATLIKPSILPRIRETVWGKAVMDEWLRRDDLSPNRNEP